MAYCTREYPKARLWLNPVVVGQGKLRVLTQLKVNPDYMRRVDSPTLLTPEFYKKGAEDYYRSETYNWECLAGEMFFDIKPNGNFWICQDHPAKTPLNILDPDFEEKYRRSDFSHRRACSGCTYSCYWITQKGFEPRNWPGMAGMWWKYVTQPGEPCQKTAREHGWVAGLIHFSAIRLVGFARAAAKTALWLALLVALTGVEPGAAQSAPPLIAPEEVIARMEQASARRQEALHSYHCRRRYYAEHPILRRRAYMVVEARFESPEEKQFQIIERGGSRTVERRVFLPLLETERANARLAARKGVEISRDNYTFSFEGFDAAARACVFKAEPRTRNKYQFRGKVWIDTEDFAVQRVEGEPAQRPSFWVRRTHFVHKYAKFGEFWLPVSNRTEVELRVFGRAGVGIDYYDYDWKPRVIREGTAPNADETAPAKTPVRSDSVR